MDDSFQTLLETVWDTLQAVLLLAATHGMQAATFATKWTVATAQSEGGLATLAITMMTVLVAYVMLGMIFRYVMWWIRFVFKMLFMLTMVVAVLWVFQRGPDGALEDVKVVGDFWLSQYQMYSKAGQTGKPILDALKEYGGGGLKQQLQHVFDL